MGAFAFFISLFSCGCAYHRVGWNHAPVQIIHVAPVVNHSGHAGIGGTLRQQLIQEINTCPEFATGPAANAKFTLDVAIDDLSQTIGTTFPKNPDTVHSYTLTLTASCTLVERDTGREVLPRQALQATVVLPTHPSFTEAKRQAMVQISRSLAKKIGNLLSSTVDFP
jgi:hypothetical protein